MQVEPLGLRQVKKADTRRRLTLAARSLVAEHGLDRVTVERIGAEAGVSPRTFFNYFDSKELAVLGEEPPLGTSESRAQFVAGGPTGEVLVDLLDLLDPSVSVAGEGRAGLRAVLQLVSTEPRLLATYVARQVAREGDVAKLVAARRGLSEPDRGARVLAAVAFALLREAGRAWFDADDGSPFGHHLATVRDALADELGESAPSNP